MKHVFVETNFLVDLLRPFPIPDAQVLFERAGRREVRLYVPWPSVSETRRTLVKLINDELSFNKKLLTLAAQQMSLGGLAHHEMTTLQKFEKLASTKRRTALEQINTAVDQAIATMTVIEPSPPVIEKTLSLYAVKSLPPFDEMIMAAVLVQADQLHQQGETDLYFCNLNKSDFAPPGDPNTPSRLADEYALCGLTYLPSFRVP